MRRVAVVAAALAALSYPPFASGATPPHYVPRAHQKCRVNYRREIWRVWKREHGKRQHVREAVCVQSKRPTTSNAEADFDLTPDWSSTYYSVSGDVWSGAKQIYGLPITYSVYDATTRRTVATFKGTSNLFETCTVVPTIDDAANTQTLSGEAVAPYQACALASVTIPASDVASLVVSFAGNSKYASSKSAGVAF